MDSVGFLIFISALSIMPAADIYLPSLPDMAHYFSVSEETIRGTVTAYLVGSLVAALPIGALSDRIGRKKVLVGALCLFILGSLFCCLANTFVPLIIGRFLQGMGGVAIPVVGYVIIHDYYPPTRAIKVMAVLGMVMATSPLVSPSIGGLIDTHWGWRWNFILLVLVTAVVTTACFLYLPETAPKSTSCSRNIHFLIHPYISAFNNRNFLIYVSIFGLLSSGEWCYLTMAPFYFERVLGMDNQLCGVYISSIAASYLLGSTLVPSFVKALGLPGCIKSGILCSFGGASLLLLAHFKLAQNITAITISVSLYLLGLSLVWTPTASLALQSVSEKRGGAAAVRSLLLTLSVVLGSVFGTLMPYQSTLPLAVFLLGCVVLAWFLQGSIALTPKKSAL